MPTYWVFSNVLSQKWLNSRKFIRLNDFPSKTLVKLFTTEGNPNGRETDSKVPLQVATNNKRRSTHSELNFFGSYSCHPDFQCTYEMTVFLEIPHGVIWRPCLSKLLPLVHCYVNSKFRLSLFCAFRFLKCNVEIICPNDAFLRCQFLVIDQSLNGTLIQSCHWLKILVRRPGSYYLSDRNKSRISVEVYTHLVTDIWPVFAQYIFAQLSHIPT